jgi:hypothetical protein
MGEIFMGDTKVCSHLSRTGTFHRLKGEQQMTKHRLFRQGIIRVVGGALLVTFLGCSTPLSTREKGALIGGGAGIGAGALMGGGTGAVIGGALGAGGGALIGDQLQK